MALTKASYSMIQGAPINVMDYGADNTGATSSTVAIQAAINACPTNGTVYLPAGTYSAYLFVWRGDISIIGDGSGSTVIMLPNNCPTVTVPWSGGGTITGLPNVIEVGQCALGNSAPAYSKVTIRGFTIDGNYSNNTAPTTDLFGHGIIVTNTSYATFDDIVAKNCFNTGCDNVINSNYNIWNARVANCGNATISGGHYPNFDINSSQYGQFNVVSSGGYYGCRILDNCYGNIANFSIQNPSIIGFAYNNQPTNSSYDNNITVTVNQGCTGPGVYVGNNCINSIINATISNVSAAGMLISGVASGTKASGNKITCNTYNCQSFGFSDDQYCTNNTYILNSKQDGRSGSVGASFAVYVYGSYNIITTTIQEGSVAQVRGLKLNTTSSNNEISSFTFDPNLVQDFLDVGTQNSKNFGSGTFPVASGATIDFLSLGSMALVSGTTTIVSINGAAKNQGRAVMLNFASSLTVRSAPGSGGNIKLAGAADFSATANDILTLVSDGTNYIEVSRSLN
jgi:hypothetical protein